MVNHSSYPGDLSYLGEMGEKGCGGDRERNQLSRCAPAEGCTVKMRGARNPDAENAAVTASVTAVRVSRATRAIAAPPKPGPRDN